MKKSPLKSKTLWFNLIMLGLFVVELIPDTLTAFGIEDATKIKIVAITGVLTAVGNKVLRLFTTTALGSEDVA